jgi:hypothetical protein
MEKQTQELYSLLSIDEKRNLADNANCPAWLLTELSKGGDVNVRRYVANNPNTPVDVLKELSKDEEWITRGIVANNTNATEQVLVSVFEYERSHRKRKEILEAIISNANCPGYLKAVIQTMLEEMK